MHARTRFGARRCCLPPIKGRGHRHALKAFQGCGMATAFRARAWGTALLSSESHLRLDELRILGVLGFELRGWGASEGYGAHMWR